jgi:hypothetical protein
MSKKNVSVFVSAAGLIGGFIDKLITAFQKCGGTDDDLHQLLVGSKSEEFVAKVTNLAMEMVKGAKPVFPIFKTITLGVCKSVKAYCEALTKAGLRIGGWASDILKQIQASQSQVQLDLVALSVAELGFKDAVSLDQIYARAKEFGLELCPPEVGPALYLVYAKQPYGEYLRIAMEPITAPAGALRLFEVNHDGADQWLGANCGNPGNLWNLGDRFVFVLPRK